MRIVVPQRGDKRGLIELANRNAALGYQYALQPDDDRAVRRARNAAATSGLPALPRRIECFDISTIQGSETVASMVVCEDGRMRRRNTGNSGSGELVRPGSGLGRPGAETHRVRVREVSAAAPGPSAQPPVSNNDFAAMHEVVRRRYRKLLEQGGPFPDLILIDGGKGQLSAAYAALEALGLANLVAVGIAKKEELLFTRDRDEPIALAANDPALLLCSASATKRIASRSRSTAGRARCAICGRSSMTSRASARAAAGRC